MSDRSERAGEASFDEILMIKRRARDGLLRRCSQQMVKALNLWRDLSKRRYVATYQLHGHNDLAVSITMNKTSSKCALTYGAVMQEPPL